MMDAPTQEISPTPGDQLAELNNRGKFRTALRLGRHYEHELGAISPKLDAQFWLQRARAHELVPGEFDEALSQYYYNASQSRGYSRTLYGDVLRDIAAELIRRRKRPLHIIRLMDLASTIHGEDVGRTAALLMQYGRLEYAEGRYAQSLDMHEEAKQLWSWLDDNKRHALSLQLPLQRWELENQFYLLRVSRAIDSASGRKSDAAPYPPTTTDGTTTWYRTWRLRQHLLYNFGGKPTLMLDRFIEKRISPQPIV